MPVEQVSNDEMRRWLKALVEEESPSGYASGIKAVMEQIANILKPADVEIIWHWRGGMPILEMKRGAGGPLLLGHADTVWPIGTLTQMPYRDEGETVHGPGVLDMKAGLVIGAAALRDLPKEVPFSFVITPDEEVGSALSRLFIEQAAQSHSLVLVLESGLENGGLKIGRAGVGQYRLQVTGVESHAGLDPTKGASAIRELAQQILWLATLENRILQTTINVGTVQGGTRSNVMAGHAEAQLDIRVRTNSEGERIAAILRNPPVFDKRTTVSYAGDFSRPPMEPGPLHGGWFEKASELWMQYTGEKLAGSRVGGASDGNFCARLTPTLDGVGAVGKGAHARHEQVLWRFMEARKDLIGGLIRMANDGVRTE